MAVCNTRKFLDAKYIISRNCRIFQKNPFNYGNFIPDKVKYMINHGSVPLLDQDIYELYITAYEIEMNVQCCYGICEDINIVRRLKFRACMAELSQILSSENVNWYNILCVLHYIYTNNNTDEQDNAFWYIGTLSQYKIFKPFGYELPFQIHLANKTGVNVDIILNAYAALDLLSYDIIDNTHVNTFLNFINTRT